MPIKDIVEVLLAAALLIVSVTVSLILLLKHFRKNKTRPFAITPPSETEREAQLLKTQLELQEQTFQHISQEIHDNIGQALTFVKLNMHTIDLHKPEETENKLSESKALIAKAIQDLRYIAKSLNTDFINEAGLAACIEHQLHFLEKTGLYTTSLSIDDRWTKNTPEIELVLFRVIQELLNNIVKHAEASHIAIELHHPPQSLSITVRDNGKGFIPQPQVLHECEKGLGLSSMNKRLAMIHGQIIIESTPGAGTIVHIEVPQQGEESRVTAKKSSDMYNYLPV
jgi:signal transduction histidine kinase